MQIGSVVLLNCEARLTSHLAVRALVPACLAKLTFIALQSRFSAIIGPVCRY